MIILCLIISPITNESMYPHLPVAAKRQNCLGHMELSFCLANNSSGSELVLPVPV